MQKSKPVEPQTLRVIKKYPNRRLYDTKSSSYVTLAELKQLVMDNQSFEVRDAKSAENLTRSILLQIILEEEAGGLPMFSEPMLANIIRFYGNAMQSFMGKYLEANIQSFIDLQHKLAEQSQELGPERWAALFGGQTPPMQNLMGSYMEQSQQAFAQMQEQMQKQAEQFMGAFGLKPTGKG